MELFLLRGRMYRENREGAIIEPCRRPQVRGAGEEVKLPSFTKNFLSDRYD